jgi:hypothetical protein
VRVRPARGCRVGTALSIGRSSSACWTSHSITRAADGCQKPRSARPTRAAIVPQSRTARRSGCEPRTDARPGSRSYIRAQWVCRRARSVRGTWSAAGNRPRQGDRQTGIHLGDALGGERLHVQLVGRLGGVGDLQHGRALAVDQERLVALAVDLGCAPSVPNSSRASAAASCSVKAGVPRSGRFRRRPRAWRQDSARRARLKSHPCVGSDETDDDMYAGHLHGHRSSVARSPKASTQGALSTLLLASPR